MVDAFVSLQPKTYAYRMLALKGEDGTRCFRSKNHDTCPHPGACQRTKDVVKSAGLYLNFATSTTETSYCTCRGKSCTCKVNYDTLKDLITHEESKLVIGGIQEIRASKDTRELANRVGVKEVKRSYQKGELKVDQYGNIKSLPIGFDMSSECLVEVEVEYPRLNLDWFWA